MLEFRFELIGVPLFYELLATQSKYLFSVGNFA